MPNEYNEPWIVEPSRSFYGGKSRITDASATIVVDTWCYPNGTPNHFPDGLLERIVACCNACAGISTDELTELGIMRHPEAIRRYFNPDLNTEEGRRLFDERNPPRDKPNYPNYGI